MRKRVLLTVVFCYIVISMKNDFKTIYGPGVKKVDFTF